MCKLPGSANALLYRGAIAIRLPLICLGGRESLASVFRGGVDWQCCISAGLFLSVLLQRSLGQLAALHLDGNDSLGPGKSLVAQELGVHAASGAETVALGLLDTCRQPHTSVHERLANQRPRRAQRGNVPLRWAL